MLRCFDVRFIYSSNTSQNPNHVVGTTNQIDLGYVVQISNETNPRKHSRKTLKCDIYIIQVSQMSFMRAISSWLQVTQDFGLTIHTFQHKGVNISQSQFMYFVTIIPSHTIHPDYSLAVSSLTQTLCGAQAQARSFVNNLAKSISFCGCSPKPRALRRDQQCCVYFPFRCNLNMQYHHPFRVSSLPCPIHILILLVDNGLVISIVVNYNSYVYVCVVKQYSLTQKNSFCEH